jgi:hypothetical protein
MACLLLRQRRSTPTCWHSSRAEAATRTVSNALVHERNAVGIQNHGMEWTNSTFIPTLGFTLIGIAATSVIAMSLQPGSKTQTFPSIFWAVQLWHLRLPLFHRRSAHHAPARLLQQPLPLQGPERLSWSSPRRGTIRSGRPCQLPPLRAPFLNLKRFFSYAQTPSRQPATESI